MEEETIRLIITVSSTTIVGLLGAGAGIYVARGQIRHQADLERERRYVEKLEKIHYALSYVANRAADVRITWNAGEGYGVEVVSTKQHDLKMEPELAMLVDLYLPELKPEIEIIDKETAKFIDLILRVQSLPPQVEDVLGGRFQQLCMEIVACAAVTEKTALRAKTKLIALARRDHKLTAQPSATSSFFRVLKRALTSGASSRKSESPAH